jgi:hypothetical protein
MTEAVIALTSALIGVLLSNGFAVYMAYRQRQQRMLDLVIALHAEIDAGLQTIGRQLTEEEIAYAMQNSNPFGTPDETDTVFESVKDDLSILPIDVIHEVVRYYRLSRQTNLLTADTRHPMFFKQRPAERRKFVGQIMRKGNEQYAAGVAALEALERFGLAKGRALHNKRSGTRDIPTLPDLSTMERIKRMVRSGPSREPPRRVAKSDKSDQSSSLPRGSKSRPLDIGAKRQKEK